MVYLQKVYCLLFVHENAYCSLCDDGLPFFEISAINADKPPLSIDEIKKRVEQFRKAGMAQQHLCHDLHYSIIIGLCLGCYANLLNVKTEFWFTIQLCHAHASW